mmetsp:Transcript_8645/g.19993  ORF Transcript_8645/g.19993 Transcript_8645/m.19993 type:complete len:154 (+) Transcript_8645:75-536(+)
MDRVEADATPAEEWQASLNATCNRLSTQYLSLIRAASSVSALEEMGGRQDPRGGGGVMKSMQEPPPPLAADAELHELQAQLAVENLCVASSHLLELIRTLRLSVLLMDEDTIAAEEQLQVLESQQITMEAKEKSQEIEAELLKLRNDQTYSSS